MNLEEILSLAIKEGSSDIHLKSGFKPIIRKNGKLKPMDLPKISAANLEKIIQSYLRKDLEEKYSNNEEVDFGFRIKELGRFRINLCQQMGLPRAVIRVIPEKIPALDTLNLPPILEKIARLKRGLILVTGVTGSGKSTTTASIIDYINKRQNKHIITIEDPVEYIIKDKKSLITQREIGTDSQNFNSAFRSALRQDPDIIFIGEMRDAQTIETSLRAATSGHLVLSTLHTVDTTETVSRILSYFPPKQQSQIRVDLASSIKAIVSQRLIKAKDSTGTAVIPAVEILINNQRIRKFIKNPEKAEGSIESLIEEGNETYQMQTFDQSLLSLVLEDKVSYSEALKHSSVPEDFSIKYKNSQLNLTPQLKYKDKPSTKSDGGAKASFWENVQDIELESKSEKKTTPGFHKKRKV